MDAMTDEEYRQQAKALFQRDGEIEIDEEAAVSDALPGSPRHDLGDRGAYVAAWVWVPELEEPS